MTEIMTLTGNESSAELMELRRSIVSTRRNRQAAFLLTGTGRPEKTAEISSASPLPNIPLSHNSDHNFFHIKRIPS